MTFALTNNKNFSSNCDLAQPFVFKDSVRTLLRLSNSWPALLMSLAWYWTNPTIARPTTLWDALQGNYKLSYYTSATTPVVSQVTAYTACLLSFITAIATDSLKSDKLCTNLRMYQLKYNDCLNRTVTHETIMHFRRKWNLPNLSVLLIQRLRQRFGVVP